MVTPFGCTRVAAHFNWWKHFEALFGLRQITVSVARLVLSSCCVPPVQGHRRYLRTLFVFSSNRNLTSQLQIYASMFAKRANFVDTRARDHECRRGVVQRMMQQAPPERLTNAVATP